MAGTPADLREYADPIATHEITYKGNSCPGSWGTGGDGGSITPCANGTIDNTSDNELLSVGTLYNYSAATSGTGATITTNNTNIPDSFCPLGWQLPYGGTGGDYYNQSKSYKYMFQVYNVTSGESLRKYPISFVRAGFFMLWTGRLYSFQQRIDAWTATNANGSSYAYELRTIDSGQQDTKSMAMSVRCLHRRHGGRNRY